MAVELDGGRYERTPAECDSQLWEIFKSLSLSPNRIPFESSYSFVAKQARVQGLAFLSRDAARERLAREAPDRAMALARYGPKRFEADRVPKVLDRDLSPVMVGDEIVFDNRKLDLFARFPHCRQQWIVGRVWISSAMDVRSRYFVVDLRRSVCVEGVLAVAAKVFRRFGRMLRVKLDNGNEFKAAFGHPRGSERQRNLFSDERIGSVFARLGGVEVVHAPAKEPWNKSIEPNFRPALKEALDRWTPSFVGGSPAEKPHDADWWRKNPQALMALPTIDEVREWVDLALAA